jgi:polyisoprenyl-teichoic acid--peptidoglycan teichoic acid transferase
VRRVTVFFAVVAFTMGLVGGAAAGVSYEASVRPGHAHDGLLVILAIGSDVGPPHRPGDPLRGRADGIHLIAVDTESLRATVVNIPRDTVMAGQKGSDVLFHGGPGAVKAAVEDLSGIPIDYWALMTFRSVEQVVDGLGGVEVDVRQRMADPFSGSDFQPGPQRLAGHQALSFVRDRNSLPNGDLGRSAHHGQLLRATHRQIRAHDADLPSLTRLVGLFARNTVTDIPTSQLLPLALTAVRIDPADIRQDALGGSVGSLGPQSVVFLRPGDAFARIQAGQVGP